MTPDSTAVDAVDTYTTDERSISPRVQLLWGSRLLIGVAVLAAIGLFAAGRLGAPAVLSPALAVVLAGVGLVWVHLRYRVWRYRVREDALSLQRGVVTQVHTVAPHVRIQHVDTSRGPLERLLGLSTLVVYTAGSRGADVSIPGLEPAVASDLQHRLKELAIETDGGDAL